MAEKFGFLTDEGQKKIRVDVIAAEDVEKSNWFVLMMRGIGHFFGDLWGGISSTVKGLVLIGNELTKGVLVLTGTLFCCFNYLWEQSNFSTELALIS